MLTRMLMAVVATVPAACLGDTGYPVWIDNATSQTVYVSQLGANPGLEKPTEIGPGRRLETLWLVPKDDGDPRLVTVQATNAEGRVLYCERISHAEKNRRGKVIRVLENVNTC